jgi:hypothetical protein
MEKKDNKIEKRQRSRIDKEQDTREVELIGKGCNYLLF